MTSDDKDPPLEVIEDGGRYVGQVVDLADVRIRQGRTPYKFKNCDHHSIIYCTSERRVWCEDCKRTIDNFDAFLIFTRKFEEMVRDARHKMDRADEAMKSSVRRRATKELDRAWSGRAEMAVCCPHCRTGLLPEDFADRGSSRVSAEIERARRRKTPIADTLTLGVENTRLKMALAPFSRYYDLNDCAERDPDDALEVPIRDLKRAHDLINPEDE